MKQEDLFSMRQGGVREVGMGTDMGRGNYFFFTPTPEGRGGIS